MNPTIMSDVAKHRIADWHRQADHDRSARAARATRTKHASHRLSITLAGLAAAVLALPPAKAPPPRPATSHTTTRGKP